MSETSNAVSKLAARYAEKPIIRSLLQLVPGWGAADTLLQQRAYEIKTDRLKTFFDELAEGKKELTEELIETEDFLHCYFSTLQAVLNTRQREKIKLLARLLDSSFLSSEQTNTDEYEELLSVLNSVTLREFSVLYELHSYELRHPRKDNENDLQNARNYWDDFKSGIISKYSIPKQSFTAFMSKTERTGLYLRITGTFLDYQGDVGRTTPLFVRLLEFVKQTG